MSNAEGGIYPIVMFPTFEVNDLRESIEWYTNVMGFVLMYEMPDPDGNAHMAHVRKEKYQDIMLIGRNNRKNDDMIKKGVGVTITFQFTGNDGDHHISIDEYASKIREAGVTVLEGPVNRPWNTRELTVSDPDGYRLIFSAVRGEKMKKDFNETMNKVRGTLFKSN